MKQSMGESEELVDANVRERIEGLLSSLADEKGWIIPFAVESGSRVWGFASENSDYDVRFVYVQKPQVYLNLWESECPDNYQQTYREQGMDLDIVGWDVKKAMRLLSQSNPGFSEWIGSRNVREPYIWNERSSVLKQITHVTENMVNTKALMHHYRSSAKKNYEDFIRPNTGDVSLKKYLYILRPLLCCESLEAQPEFLPSMNVEALLSQYSTLPSANMYVCSVMQEWIELKRFGVEKAVVGRDSEIDKWIEQRLLYYAALAPTYSNPDAVMRKSMCNTLFLHMLAETWGHYSKHTGPYFNVRV